MRKALKRLWCRLSHGLLWKSEQVSSFLWRKRCLECGETYPFKPRQP